MIITAVLAAGVAFLLGYGAVSPMLLAALCVGTGLALLLFGGHSHGGVLHIDVLAQRSRLNRVNPALKVWGCVALLLICVAADTPVIGLLLTALLPVLTVGLGRLRLGDYLSLLALPAAFLLLSTLALTVDFAAGAHGVLNLPLFGGWLVVTPESQARSLLILCKSLGAVSSLYLMSLSTPMSEVIGVLRAAHVPAVVAELMYLIYRYIFILLEMHRSMRDAAESRLGYHGLSAGLRTTGAVYAGLLSRSFRRAGACFDAMESRCYDGEIRFLEAAKPITALHGAAAGCLVALVSALAVWGRYL